MNLLKNKHVINCTLFDKGKCIHQNAPRSWFRTTKCILIHEPIDSRMIVECKLRSPLMRNDVKRPPKDE